MLTGSRWTRNPRSRRLQLDVLARYRAITSDYVRSAHESVRFGDEFGRFRYEDARLPNETARFETDTTRKLPRRRRYLRGYFVLEAHPATATELRSSRFIVGFRVSRVRFRLKSVRFRRLIGQIRRGIVLFRRVIVRKRSETRAIGESGFREGGRGGLLPD
jgi:hypothetical protein